MAVNKDTKPTVKAVPWMHGAAGIAGGAISMTMFYPLDLLRTRAHTQTAQGSRLRSAGVLFKQEGMRGMYRGVTMAVCAHSIGWGTYLTLFRTSQNGARRLNGSDTDTVGGDFVSALVAATATSTLVTPLNLIKTRVQLHDTPGKKPKGVVSGLRMVVREEGFRSLFRGVGPQILLASHTSIQVALYEFIKRKWWCGEEPPMSGVALASGASKGVAAVVCNPLEVCRTRLQDKKNIGGVDYSSMRIAFRTIWEQEGVRGMYRGTGVNLCRVIPTTVVAFVLYEKFLKGIQFMAGPKEIQERRLQPL